MLLKFSFAALYIYTRTSLRLEHSPVASGKFTRFRNSFANSRNSDLRRFRNSSANSRNSDLRRFRNSSANSRNSELSRFRNSSASSRNSDFSYMNNFVFIRYITYRKKMLMATVFLVYKQRPLQHMLFSHIWWVSSSVYEWGWGVLPPPSLHNGSPHPSHAQTALGGVSGHP